MRIAKRICKGLILIGLGVSQAAHASQCRGVDAVIEHLGQGVIDSSFPSIEGCPDDFEIALAQAISTAIERSGDPRQLAGLLTRIGDEHKRTKHLTPYATLAGQLQKDLAATKYKFDFNQQTPWSLLDPLIAQLGQQPAPGPRTPVADCGSVGSATANLERDVIPDDIGIATCTSTDELASAFAAAIERASAQKSDDRAKLAHLLERVRDGYRESKLPAADAKRAFLGFAKWLGAKLKDGQYRLPEIDEARGFDALAPLIESLRKDPPNRWPWVLAAIGIALAAVGTTAFFLRHRLKSMLRKPAATPRTGQTTVGLVTGDVLRINNELTDLRKRVSEQEQRTAGLQAGKSTDDIPQVKQITEKLKNMHDICGRMQNQIDTLRASMPRPEAFARVSREDPNLTTKMAQLGQELSILRNQLAQMRKSPGEPASKPLSFTYSPVPLELEALGESWRQFSEKNDRAQSLADELASDPKWERIRDDLLRQLPRIVAPHDDLRATYESVLGPLKDFSYFVSKLSLISKLFPKDGKPTVNFQDESEAKKLQRIRELANLLTILQNSNLVSDRLNFRPEKWAEESFISFADLFLQKYQQALFSANAELLEEGSTIVLRTLKMAGIEPIEIHLGRTHFDSARHIGRSTSSRPELPDGVIVGVVRNGFVKGGRQVIRQPEVVVNRL